MAAKINLLENIVNKDGDSYTALDEDQKKEEVHSGFAEFYFKPRAIERWKDGLVYKALGVGIFKKIVPTGGTYASKLSGISLLSKDLDKVEAFKEYEPSTRVYELIHMPISILVTPFVINFLLDGDFTNPAVVLNLFGNFYPVLLQRYNRARIYNLLEEDKSEKLLE